MFLCLLTVWSAEDFPQLPESEVDIGALLASLQPSEEESEAVVPQEPEHESVQALPQEQLRIDVQDPQNVWVTYPGQQPILIGGLDALKAFIGQIEVTAHKIEENMIPPGDYPQEPESQQSEEVTPAVETAPVLINKAYNDQDYNDAVNRPIAIEIFGNENCPYCVEAANLAKTIQQQYGIDQRLRDIGRPRTTPEERLPDENANRDASKAILEAVGSNQTSMPRISIIDNQNIRWFLGGFSDFQYFAQVHFPPKAQISATDNPTSVAEPQASSEPTTEPAVETPIVEQPSAAPVVAEAPQTKEVQKSEPDVAAPYRHGIWSAWVK